MKVFGEVEVSWGHNQQEGKTTCKVKVGEQIFEGQSVLKHGDQYSRMTGRKHSLRSAFRTAGKNVDKETRTAIWTGLAKRGVKMVPESDKARMEKRIARRMNP